MKIKKHIFVGTYKTYFVRLQRHFKSTLFLVLFSLFTGIRAQTLSTSSYSHQGFGKKLFDNDVLIKSMGGISTAYEIPLGSGTNFSNPAANHKISGSVFSLEGASFWTKYSGKNAPELKNTFYFSKISLGFPLNEKWRLALAYQPYSGYFHSFSKDTIPDEISKETPQVDNIRGSGGLNAAQGLINYSVNKNFHLGISGSYLFGTLERTYEKKISENNRKSWELDDKIKGLEIRMGALYSEVFETGKRWTIGATYGIGTPSDLKRSFSLEETKTVEENNTNPGKEQEKIKKSKTDHTSLKSSKISFRIPDSFSLGFAYGEDFRWMLSGQFDWNKNSELNSLTLPKAKEREYYKNSQRFSLGGYWIPKYNSYKSYFSRVIYRAGFYYENTGLVISRHLINDYGLSLGASFPLKIKKELDEESSYLNVGFALGQRGTDRQELFKETYANLRVGLLFGAKWFKKRLYR